MNRDKWSSLVWLAVSMVICTGAVRLSVGTFQNPGPGFLPFLTGAILGILSLIVHIQSRRAPLAAEGAGPIWTDRAKGLKMVWTVIALLSFAVGMNYLGFLVSTVLFIGFLLRAVEPQRWSKVILGSCLTAVLSYCIFELWLQSQLPRGPFEIF